VPGVLSARNIAGYPAICRIGVVADRGLWPTYVLARQDTEEAWTVVLMHHEWQALYCTNHQKPHSSTTAARSAGIGQLRVF
jgi:hypothetical protein